MKKIRFALAAVLLALALTGCGAGIIYTHTMQPLTLDMHRTPVAKVEKEGSIQVITLPPISGNYKLVAWGSAAIADVAKKEGMQEVYYADLETFSVLNVWHQYIIHVYGK